EARAWLETVLARPLLTVAAVDGGEPPEGEEPSGLDGFRGGPVRLGLAGPLEVEAGTAWTAARTDAARALAPLVDELFAGRARSRPTTTSCARRSTGCSAAGVTVRSCTATSSGRRRRRGGPSARWRSSTGGRRRTTAPSASCPGPATSRCCPGPSSPRPAASR